MDFPKVPTRTNYVTLLTAATAATDGTVRLNIHKKTQLQNK